jgi:hypothetical protein
MQFDHLRRREFVTLLGGGAAGRRGRWPPERIPALRRQPAPPGTR